MQLIDVFLTALFVNSDYFPKRQ